MTPLLPHVLWAARHMAILLSLRLLPFAVYGVFVSATIPRRLLVGTAYLMLPALACHLGARSTIELIALGSAYYLVLSIGVYRLADLVAAGHASRSTVFIILFLAFLLVPGVALPGVAILVFLIVGWELLLSSYSYCVETARAGAPKPTLRECLFFLLVNPTLVYTARGTAVPSPPGLRGLGRAGLGMALLFLNAAFLRPLVLALPTVLGSLSSGARSLWLFYGAAQFFTFYISHAGLASVHIGLMRQAGWVVPERYRFPLAARSPMDFWRRWNTYVRVWLEAYVFLPTARRLARKVGRMGPAWAAVITLIASGLLHDVYVFAGRQTFGDLQKTQLFVAACVFLGLWHVARRLGSVVREYLDPRQRSWFEVLVSVSARASMLVAVAGAATRWA